MISCCLGNEISFNVCRTYTHVCDGGKKVKKYLKTVIPTVSPGGSFPITRDVLGAVLDEFDYEGSRFEACILLKDLLGKNEGILKIALLSLHFYNDRKALVDAIGVKFPNLVDNQATANANSEQFVSNSSEDTVNSKTVDAKVKKHSNLAATTTMGEGLVDPNKTRNSIIDPHP